MYKRDKQTKSTKDLLDQKAFQGSQTESRKNLPPKIPTSSKLLKGTVSPNYTSQKALLPLTTQ